MACPKCGREINREQFPLGLVFCPHCGDRVSEHDPSRGISFCPYCGRRLLIAASFCPECGKHIAPGAAPSHAAADVPVHTSFDTPALSKAPHPSRKQFSPEADDYIPRDTAEEPTPPPSRSIWPKVTAFCRRHIYEPIASLFTGRWRLKRLYQDWSTHDALPPEEIPNDDYLKNMPRQKSPSKQRVPPWLIMMAVVGVILIFTAVGILIKRC